MPHLKFVSCFFVCTALIAAHSLARAREASPPDPQRYTFTVDLAGTADFKSIQQAVDALPATGGLIRIRPGDYREKIQIDKPHVHLLGLGKNPSDVVLTYNLSHHDVKTTWGSASTTVTGDDFLAENLTFQNTFSDEHPEATVDAQAVALRVTGDRDVFRNVRILAHQDTLYADSKNCRAPSVTASVSATPAATNGSPANAPAENIPSAPPALPPCTASRQLYLDSYIAGTIDFIFGDAKAVFEHCEIHSLPHQEGTLTAQSRYYPGEDSGYVFDNCTLTADPGVTNVYLGRPWRLYSTVIFLHTEMGAHISPAGWLEWTRENTTGLATSTYAEFRSLGPGAPQLAQNRSATPGPDGTQRVPQSKFLTPAEAKQYDPRTFLRGHDSWSPKL